MALWTAVLVYSLLSITLGPSGFSAMESLRGERDRLSANLQELRGINTELEGSMDSLRYSPDAIGVYARELGYGAADERFVRIVGLGASGRQRVRVGNLIVPRWPRPVPDTVLRMLSAVCGLCLWLALYILEKRKQTRGAIRP